MYKETVEKLSHSQYQGNYTPTPPQHKINLKLLWVDFGWIRGRDRCAVAQILTLWRGRLIPVEGTLPIFLQDLRPFPELFFSTYVRWLEFPWIFDQIRVGRHGNPPPRPHPIRNLLYLLEKEENSTTSILESLPPSNPIWPWRVRERRDYKSRLENGKYSIILLQTMWASDILNLNPNPSPNRWNVGGSHVRSNVT